MSGIMGKQLKQNKKNGCRLSICACINQLYFSYIGMFVFEHWREQDRPILFSATCYVKLFYLLALHS